MVHGFINTFARCAVAAVSLAASTAVSQLVESDFALGAQGWTLADNGTEPLIEFSDHIGTFDGDPADLAFVAPPAFLGDLTLAYRGSLSFELLPSIRPFQPSRPVVELTGGDLGPASTPLILRRELAPPATVFEFSSHRVALSERAGWTVVGEARDATAEEMRNVLGDLQDFRIIADTAASTSESIGLRAVRIDRPRVRVVIAAGQSNMSGCGDSRDAAFDFTPRYDVIFWNHLNDAFEPLTFGTSDTDCGHDPAEQPFYFGPEISFADAYEKLLGDDLLVIIKYAAGGTSMHVDWVPPGENPARPNGGPVYNDFMAELDLVFGQLDAAGYDYTVEGMIWMQGESDTDRNNRSAAYFNDLSALIDVVRTRVANPEMAFIIARILDNDFGFDERVRDAQVLIGETDPFACWIDTDDLTKLDIVHYDEPSILTLGNRFANALRRLTGPRGDANLDGIVDIEDVHHWTQNPSDENCDGVVDQADLDVVMESVRSE